MGWGNIQTMPSSYWAHVEWLQPPAGDIDSDAVFEMCCLCTMLWKHEGNRLLLVHRGKDFNGKQQNEKQWDMVLSLNCQVITAASFNTKAQLLQIKVFFFFQTRTEILWEHVECEAHVFFFLFTRVSYGNVCLLMAPVWSWGDFEPKIQVNTNTKTVLK